MSVRITLFIATLVQDSAMSVSGLDCESVFDQPFTTVDGRSLLLGRGLKGAAVSMARRCFSDVPRCVTEDINGRSPLKRSAWEFENASPLDHGVKLAPRASVGILQETGARAEGVLHDREVVPGGTRWPLVAAVRWQYAGDDAARVEGMLFYVLDEHWGRGRCWLGAGAARGLGWCTVADDLRAYRLEADVYEKWLTVRQAHPERAFLRETLDALTDPCTDIRKPPTTRRWFFRWRDVDLHFGPYAPARPISDAPNGDEGPWGLDMLAIGPHDSEQSAQPIDSTHWAKPAWASGSPALQELETDRAVLMQSGTPVLPAASVRGPLRHAFSRRTRATRPEAVVVDPHLVQGAVPDNDEAGRIFGSTKRSSRLLMRDGTAKPGWFAARLHMHAEDEFSGGSFESAKRDATRVLSGSFPIRFVVEGPCIEDVEEITREVDHLIALGSIQQLAVGGHKTRGAGFGRWQARTAEWQRADIDVLAAPVTLPKTSVIPVGAQSEKARPQERLTDRDVPEYGGAVQPVQRYLRITAEALSPTFGGTLSDTAALARVHFGDRSDQVRWWCEPTIDFSVTEAPPTFGAAWPTRGEGRLSVDEVVFFAPTASWRAARTVEGWRFVAFTESDRGEADERVTITETPVRLHRARTRPRFNSAGLPDLGDLCVRQWYRGQELVGYTLTEAQR